MGEVGRIQSSPEVDFSGEVEYAVAEFRRELGRFVGEQGAETRELILLGMLDGGMTLPEVIETLVMHGELPAGFERTDESSVMLVDSESGWLVDPSSVNNQQ